MKKRISAIFVFSAIVATSLLLNLQAYAYDMPEKIRIGIEYGYKEVTAVPINNSDIEIGVEYKGEFYPEAQLSASSSFSVNMPSGNIIDANEFYGSYDKAIAACEDIEDMWGYDAVAAYVERELWGVYICGISNRDAEDVADDVTGKVLNSTSSIMVLKDGNREKMVFNGIYPQIAPAGREDAITLGSRSYRGEMEFGRYNGNNITAVNVATMDEYLYGVVPSEMPSSWEEEALKAQAVAARSYAATRMGIHAENGYDVCDGVNCQVYIGYGQEKDSTNEAVDATSGIGAYYDDKPINAVFFSSSGGATDDGVNVWSNDVPYLKGVEEINEVGVNTWTRTYTASEIKSILSDKGINIGDVLEMEISSATKLGRVQEVTITGTSGTKVLKKEETRTIFSGTSEGSLPSRMYTINGKGGAVITDSSDGSDSRKETADNKKNNNDEAAFSGTVYVQSKDEAGNIDLEDAYILSNSGEVTKGENLEKPYSIGRDNSISALEGSVAISAANGTTYTAAEDKFVFLGKGNGHGVGMSQYGANGMAKVGYTYKEILKHYYTGITVE